MHGKLRVKGCLAALFLSSALSTALIAPASAQPAGDPADPGTWETGEFFAQWGLDAINAQYAYMLGVDGSGVKVGIVDGGIDPSHPELAGQVAGGYDYVLGTSTLTDPGNGHGTAVASVIAAKRDGTGFHGIAPGARIVSARIFDADGSMADDDPNIGAAWSGLLDQGVRIINNSWGTVGDDYSITDLTAQDIANDMPRMLAAARSAVQRDALMIFITHNSGLAQPTPEAGLPYLFPELERGWLAVTGYEYDGIANQCGVAKNWCLAAPAAWITAAAAGGGYVEDFGTSLAAPFVAGTAALVWQMFPYMTTDQVRQILLGTATDIGDPGVDDVYGYGLLNAAAAVRGPGKFDWGDFHVVQPGGQSQFQNNISGAGGLIKSGDGVLVLSGNSTYTGHTRVDGGILALWKTASIASPTFVDAGGTLTGSGTIHGNVENRGVFRPGWGAGGGTMTIDGDYTQFAEGTMLVEVGAPDGTSRVDVSGTAMLDGTLAARLAVGGYQGDARHTIISAGTVSGHFENVLDRFAFLDLALAYDAATVYLDVARNGVAFADVAPSANGASAAHGAESLGVGNGLYDALIGLGEANARGAFAQLSGEVHASITGALIETSGALEDVASSRLRSAFADVGIPALPVMAYGPDGPELAPGDTERFAVWSQALGAWGKTDGDGNAAALDRSTGGLLMGGYATFGQNGRLGLLGGYTHTTFKSDAGTGSAENIHLGLYGGAQWGDLGLRAGAAYSWHNIETGRVVAFPGFAEQLTADYDAGTAQAFAELGYRIDAGGLALEPFAGLAYVNLHTDAFAEKGGAAAIIAATSDTNTAFATLGVNAASDFRLGGIDATARGTLGWRHAFGDVTPAASYAFAGGEAFTVTGLPIAKDALVIEAGLDLNVTHRAAIGLSYAGQVARAAQDHAFTADLTVKF